MLNPFPIQFLAPLAYMLLRFCVGILFIRIGTRTFSYRFHAPAHHTKRHIKIFSFLFFLLGLLEWCIGIGFILGASVQIMALIGLGVSLLHIFLPIQKLLTRIPSRMFFILLFFTSLSLFITGGGPFGFDLPL